MKMLITGANGMLGFAVKEKLKHLYSLICPSKEDLNLGNYDKVLDYFIKTKPDYVIHLAAKVGGVLNNQEHLGDFYIENIRMNTNVLHASFKTNVKKTLSVLSTCVYPDKVIYPLTENQIHNGPPHSSNFTYAYTKRMLDVQSRAYREQYGVNFITAIPNNIYGINDLYGSGAHVIPGLMQRFHEAKINNKPSVEVWGDGSCLREFTFSSDLARCLVNVFECYNGNDPINIGNTEEVSIKTLVNLMKNIVGFSGEIIWNDNMPSGQFRKPSSTKKYDNLMKDQLKFVSLEDGLKCTYEWFKNTYPNIRGI